MKTCAVALFAALAATLAGAQTIYQWNGSNSTVWTDATSWQPTGSGITAGPGPTGGNYAARLNVNNRTNNVLVYDATLGTTVYGVPGQRGIVIASGAAGSGSMRITGGTFSTATAGAEDVLGNNANTALLSIEGGQFIGNSFGFGMGLGAGPTSILSVISGGFSVTTLTLNATLATVHLDGGTLTANRILRGGGALSSVFNFNGGTLRSGLSNTNFMANLTGGASRANVRNGGALIDTAGFSIMIGQALEHSNIGGDAETDGGLAKNGAGALVLTNASTYNGPTVVNAGSLWINGSLSTGAVSVAGAASFGGSGTVSGQVALAAGSLLQPGPAAATLGTLTLAGSLALDGGGTARVDIAGGVLDKVAVGGTVSPAGVTTIELIGSPGSLPSGEYTLIESTGGLGGDVTNFWTAPSTTRSALYSLVYDTTSAVQRLFLDVVAGGSPSNLVWSGAGAQWDVATSANWNNGAGSDLFYHDDTVTFDGTGIAQSNINLAANVFPGGITVDTAAGDYLLATTNGSHIGGAAALTKQGAGRFTVLTDNNNSGGTAINAGTLWIGNGGTSGALGSGNVVNNGELVLDRSDSVSLADTISGTGTLTKRGAGTLTLTGTNSYGATAILAGTLQIGSGGSNGTLGVGTVTNDGTLVVNRSDNLVLDQPITGTGGLTKLGVGILTVGGSNDYTGAINISVGALQATNSHALGVATGAVAVATNATLALSGGIDAGADKPLSITGPGALGAHYFFTNSFVQRGAIQSLGGSNTWRGPISFSSAANNTRIGVQDGAQLVLTGPITESVPGSSLYFRHGGAAGSDIVLMGSNSHWTGETQIFGGAGGVRLGAHHGLSTAAVLRIGTTGIAGESLLDLNGFDQAAAGLNRVGAGNARVINNGPTPSTLLLNPTNNVFYFGAITDGAGTLSVVKGGPFTQGFSSNLTYTGRTRVNEGVLELYALGALGSSTSITIASGATIAVTQRVDLALQLGPAQRLEGGGTVLGNLVSQGRIAPGASAGTLTVQGSYTQVLGQLDVEIGGPAAGTDYDQLAVSGEAAIAGGTLNVSFIGGYTGTAGHVFNVVTATSGGGFLDATNLPALSPGHGWDVQVTTTGIVLSITNDAPPSSGYDLFAAAITNGLTGYQDDADSDGYANLLEYVTGGDPTSGDTAARMTGTRTGGLLSLLFQRDTNVLDATIIVEGSDSAANDVPWLGIATNAGGSWGGATNVQETGLSSPVSVRVQDDVAGATNRFLRLRVTRP